MTDISGVGRMGCVRKSDTELSGTLDKSRALSRSEEAPSLGGTTGFGALGLDALVAALAIESGQIAQRAVQDAQREAKLAMREASARQIAELREKASDTRNEARLGAVLGVAAGALTVASGCVQGHFQQGNWQPGKWQQPLQQIGKQVGDVATPVSKATYGAAALDHEADATRAARDEKTAEQQRDDAASIAKAAQQTIERATQAIASLVAERQATARAILRSA